MIIDITPDQQIQIATTTVQAVAAVVIVGLTGFLVWYARGATEAAKRQAGVANEALKAANKQAEVSGAAVAAANRQATLAAQALEVAQAQATTAHESLRDTQRQSRLASVRLLRLEAPKTAETAEGLVTLVDVHNKSPQPAIDIEVRVFGHDHGERLKGPYGESPQIPVLLAGDSSRVAIGTQEIKHTPSGIPRRDGGGQRIRPDPAYSYDRLVLEVKWKTLVGAVLTVSYLWHANRPEYEHAWRLREVIVQPWGNDTDEIRVEGRP